MEGGARRSVRGPRVPFLVGVGVNTSKSDVLSMVTTEGDMVENFALVAPCGKVLQPRLIEESQVERQRKSLC